MARRIDDESATRRLAGDAGAPAPQRDRRAALVGGRDGRGKLLRGARDDDPKGHVPVVRRVGGVQRPRTGVECDEPGDRLA